MQYVPLRGFESIYEGKRMRLSCSHSFMCRTILFWSLTIILVSFLIVVVEPKIGSTQPLWEERLIFDPDREDHGHVHASCVIECPNGDLLAVWYENGIRREDYYYTLDADKSDDVRIAAAWLRKGKHEWDKSFVISDTYGVSDNNPCLAIDREKRLWLIHSTMLGAPQSTWGGSLLCYKVSTDYQGRERPRWERESILIVRPPLLDETVAHNADWLRRTADGGNPHEVYAKALLERLGDPFARRLGWMPRVHPLVMPDGTLLIPLASENFAVAAMAMTKDGGETWSFSNVVPGEHAVEQPSVLILPSGKLVAFFRDAGEEHRIKRSESTDQGVTWSPIQNTDLPNPGAGIEAVMLRSGHLALVYNDKEESPRDRLAVSVSDDEGRTWKGMRYIENTPGGRFDYPSVIQAEDGSIHASYSYNLKTIKHVRFSEEWIQQGN